MFTSLDRQLMFTALHDLLMGDLSMNAIEGIQLMGTLKKFGKLPESERGEVHDRYLRKALECWLANDKRAPGLLLELLKGAKPA